MGFNGCQNSPKTGGSSQRVGRVFEWGSLDPIKNIIQEATVAEKQWKFRAELEDGGKGYLLASGDMVLRPTDAADWKGHFLESVEEGERRAQIYQEKIGGNITCLISEAQG